MTAWKDLMRHDISHWSPLGKLSLWIGSTAAVVVTVQLAAWCVGLSWNAAESKGVVLSHVFGDAAGSHGP